MKAAYQDLLAMASRLAKWVMFRQEHLFFIKKAGEPACYGPLSKQSTGYIVLTCEGDVDEAFLMSLAANPAILDYCVYATADNPDAYPFGGYTHEREEVS